MKEEELISKILLELRHYPAEYQDLVQIISQSGLDTSKFPNYKPENFADDVGEIMVTLDLAIPDPQTPSPFSFIRLKISKEGMKIIDEYGSYLSYVRYNRNRTQMDIIKVRYWLLIFLGGAAIGALLTFLANLIFQR